MGDIETPEEKATADEEAATARRDVGVADMDLAKAFNQNAELLETMGYTAAATNLRTEAGSDIVAGGRALAESSELTKASVAWTLAADDLKLESRAQGQALTAAADGKAANDLLAHADSLTEDQLTHLKIVEATAPATVEVLDERATAMGRRAADESTVAEEHELAAWNLENNVK